MLLDNQLAMGIQFKSVRGLGAEPPVGSVRSQASYKPGVSGAELPWHKKFLELFFPTFLFCSKIWWIIFSNLFFIFFESSEKHFDLIASKKFHNIIYGDIVVYSLRTLSTKWPFRKKMKSQKSENYFFIGFRTLLLFWDIFFGHFWWFILVNLSSILCTKATFFQEIKIGKIVFHRFQNIAHLFG